MRNRSDRKSPARALKPDRPATMTRMPQAKVMNPTTAGTLYRSLMEYWTVPSSKASARRRYSFPGRRESLLSASCIISTSSRDPALGPLLYRMRSFTNSLSHSPPSPDSGSILLPSRFSMTTTEESFAFHREMTNQSVPAATPQTRRKRKSAEAARYKPILFILSLLSSGIIPVETGNRSPHYTP